MNTVKSMLLAACVTLLVGCPSGLHAERESGRQHLSALGSSTIAHTGSADGYMIARVFDLTHTGVPASAAAKKIALYEGKSTGGLTFEEAKTLAYDDKTGTFTVKIKAAGNNLSIDKELSFSGFKTLYADPAFSFKAE